MIGNPFFRLSLTTSSVAGDMTLQVEGLLSLSEHSVSELPGSLSGDLGLWPLWRNFENDSLNILGIKLDDGDTLDEGVPALESANTAGGLHVLGSDFRVGL